MEVVSFEGISYERKDATNSASIRFSDKDPREKIEKYIDIKKKLISLGKQTNKQTTANVLHSLDFRKNY